MTVIKYFSFNVWVIFKGEEIATPFFDVVACDINAAVADIADSYNGEFEVLNYTQKGMVSEVVYNF